MFAFLNWAFNINIGLVSVDNSVLENKRRGQGHSRLLAEVISFVEKLDHAKPDFDIRICTVLGTGQCISNRKRQILHWKRTSIVSVVSVTTVTVRFWPGLGGSGEIEIDLTWRISSGSPVGPIYL